MELVFGPSSSIIWSFENHKSLSGGLIAWSGLVSWMSTRAALFPASQCAGTTKGFCEFVGEILAAYKLKGMSVGRGEGGVSISLP